MSACEIGFHFNSWARELLSRTESERAEAIVRGRIAAGLTQEQLARVSGYSIATIQRVERLGTCHPRTLSDLCDSIERVTDRLLIS